MEIQVTQWIPFAINDSLKKWLRKVSFKTAVLATNFSSSKEPHNNEYFQVQEWKGSADGLHSSDLGWQECEERFVPLQTFLHPAPENLLQVIRYNRETESSTLRCSC